MEWVTYDENGKEHLTKVHEVECVKQVFSIKTGQFMCTCDRNVMKTVGIIRVRKINGILKTLKTLLM